MKPQIAFINASTVVGDPEALLCMKALQSQMDNDYFPIWGKTAQLFFFNQKDRKLIDKKYWHLVLLDNADQAGALGYHDLTRAGLPMGKIFAKTTMKYGGKWTVTASHELLEMLQDPYINLTANSADGNTQYAFENCDACEETDYDINGITVSNFVRPEWFEDGHHPEGTQYDFLKLIKKPFQLLPGGYIGMRDLTKSDGWTQLTAQHQSIAAAGTLPFKALQYKDLPKLGSRRERRQRGKLNWMVSELAEV